MELFKKTKKSPKPDKERLEDEVGFFEEGTVYFTTRKINGVGWVAERIERDGDSLQRTRIGDPGGRAHALEQFKIAVSKYWLWQYKNLL